MHRHGDHARRRPGYRSPRAGRAAWSRTCSAKHTQPAAAQPRAHDVDRGDRERVRRRSTKAGAALRSIASTVANRSILSSIGGGITGAGVALDAATRGLRVALVERDDLANGTSGLSSKLAHGGLRYLRQGEVAVALGVGARAPHPHDAHCAAPRAADALRRAARRSDATGVRRVRRDRHPRRRRHARRGRDAARTLARAAPDRRGEALRLIPDPAPATTCAAPSSSGTGSSRTTCGS